MPAERSGYTVTMFVLDVSASMAKTRLVELSDGRAAELSGLEWALKYLKMKIQDMIYRGLKTDKCGVILFGSPKTNNMINDDPEHSDEYEHIQEYISIQQPDARTMAKLNKIKLNDNLEHAVDPMDALIVAMQTQSDFLGKKSWTKKIVIITDGETPMELEDWEITADRLVSDEVMTYIIGVDFDEEEDDGFKEEEKSHTKKVNEEFWKEFEERLNSTDKMCGALGSLRYAIQSISTPDAKRSKSALTSTVLRLGDVATRPEEALEIIVKTGKCTAIARPKSFKKFAHLQDVCPPDMKKDDEDSQMLQLEPRPSQVLDADAPTVYVPLTSSSAYYIKDEQDENEELATGMDVKQEEPSSQTLAASLRAGLQDSARKIDEDYDEHGSTKTADDDGQEVEKEELVRGYKYGATFVPCPDNLFEPLPTKPGMQIIGFFEESNFRREYSMGEVYYVYADPDQPAQQVAFSSIVRAMREHKGKDGEVSPLMAIVRWVKRGFRGRDGGDPSMAILKPCDKDEQDVDFFLLTQMPFADDVRKYTFPSLDTLVAKDGTIVTQHPYIPTADQIEAMEDFVDAMDLMDADEDEDENPKPWFEPNESYNPAIHRVKQAMLHTGVVDDIVEDPCPPPHPELTKFFEPPENVIERSQDALEKCKEAFDIRAVPKRVVKPKADGHHHAVDFADQPLLLDETTDTRKRSGKGLENMTIDEKGDEDEVMAPPPVATMETPPRRTHAENPLPTPARSMSPGEEDGNDVDMEDGGIVDPGATTQRIIGNAFPLKDFRRRCSGDGDQVSQAVSDLGEVICEVVLGKFPYKRHGEMVDCLVAMRKVCLEQDEIAEWNDFLRELKDKCTVDEPGNPDFWEEVRKVGFGLSLIGASEAAKAGGKSKIPDARAKKFLDS